MPRTLLAVLAAALTAVAPGGLAEAAESGGPPCHQAPAPTFARTAASYPVPAVTLVDQDGREVELRTLLSTPRAVALNFIFTSCRTICPVLSASLASLHREARSDVDLVSVSIDPEFDTPRVLRGYAKRFGLGRDWKLLTGSAEAVAAVVGAFGAGSGDKNAHKPLTFVRPAGSEEWIRLEGFPSTRDLLAELRLDDRRASK
jgi:protein SCO1/2